VIALIRADLWTRRRSLTGVGLGCFVMLLAITSTYTAFGGEQGTGQAFGQGSFRKVFAAMTGSDSIDIFRPANFLGSGFAHPVFLVLTIGVALSIGGAAIAGDVETGRAEMLYTAPVSRSAILGARLISWLIAQSAVVCGGVVGALIGCRLSPDLSDVSPLVPLRVAAQFGSLIFFLGAVAFAASARAQTRGAALGAAAAFTAGSYVANLIALLWSPLRFLHRLNPFGYYNPSASADHIHWLDLALLLDGGVLLLLLSRWLLETRDLT
jgi:ABC-type transport system involved in multi-copper enzyme maturation permease subunit